VVSVAVGLGTLKGEDEGEGRVGLDGITALLRPTGEFGGFSENGEKIIEVRGRKRFNRVHLALT
jgi:hypothetical protein